MVRGDRWMLESQPYRPSIGEAAEELPAPRLSTNEKNSQSLLWSFSCAIISLLTIVVLDIFSNRTEPTYFSPYLNDAALLKRVVVPLIVACVAMSCAWLFAVPVLIAGIFKPMRWLIPAGLAFLWFALLFDWLGVITTGNPTQNYWRDPERLAWFFRGLSRSGGGMIFFLPFVYWLCVCLEQNQAEAYRTQQELEFERILEEELTKCKVGTST